MSWDQEVCDVHENQIVYGDSGCRRCAEEHEARLAALDDVGKAPGYPKDDVMTTRNTPGILRTLFGLRGRRR